LSKQQKEEIRTNNRWAWVLSALCLVPPLGAPAGILLGTILGTVGDGIKPE
jgi:hypothetical protein